jgi:hypothetical protein
MAVRPAAWFVQWLVKDRTIAPQPWHQLADVLRSSGRPEIADAVLYAGKERERQAAGWRTRKWWSFVDTYQTLCLAPTSEMKAVLGSLQYLDLAS